MHYQSVPPPFFFHFSDGTLATIIPKKDCNKLLKNLQNCKKSSRKTWLNTRNLSKSHKLFFGVWLILMKISRIYKIIFFLITFLGAILHQFAIKKKKVATNYQWNDEKNDLIMWKLNSIWMKILKHMQLKLSSNTLNSNSIDEKGDANWAHDIENTVVDSITTLMMLKKSNSEKT